MASRSGASLPRPVHRGQPCPDARSGPPSCQTREAGTTVARGQLDLPLIGLRQAKSQGTAEAVDSDRVSFLPYGPLVSDWLAFLAERLTAEFLRDMAGGPRP